LIGLFSLCLALVGIAWATGSELYLCIPISGARWHYQVNLHRPPTHPGVILGMLVLCVPLTFWLREYGVYLFVAATVGIILGSVVGAVGFHWMPSLAQLLLTGSMIATSIYAWKQKYYFED
jgi:hypothetical protein